MKINNATRKFFSAATVAVFGLGMVAAASPVSAATNTYSSGGSVYNSGEATLGTVNSGSINPWRGAWNVGAFHGGGAYEGATATVPAGAVGTVNPGPNPWRGAWNQTGDWSGAGLWAPVNAAGAVAGGIVGAATAPFGYYNNPCYQIRPTYDNFGNYLGRRWVDTCS